MREVATPGTGPDPLASSFYVTDQLYATLDMWALHWRSSEAVDDPTLRGRAERLVATEARLLDTHEYERWLTFLADECVYWIPQDEDGRSARRRVTLGFDDRRRLEDRVARLRTGYAYSQIPASRTVRVLSIVEVLPSFSDAQLFARCNFHLDAWRAGRGTSFAGWYGYAFVREGSTWRLACKQINLIDRDQGQPDSSFIL